MKCVVSVKPTLNRFWSCTQTRNIWTQLGNLINENCPHANNFSFNKPLVILAVDNNIKTDVILDLIILLVKQYIYRAKVNKEKPNLQHFGKILSARFKIEKQISITQSKYSAFTNLWRPYD